jgi:hypothetical protein
MPPVGYEATNTVFERARLFPALDHAASAVGLQTLKLRKLHVCYPISVFEDKFGIQTRLRPSHLATYKCVHHTGNNHTDASGWYGHASNVCLGDICFILADISAIVLWFSSFPLDKCRDNILK